ncbi:MAG: MBL fold metallo-hydrolase [Candidatus Brocadiaceae bacterium]|jgi:phosphoribosyl 1,2-cyclic phosphodiesterase
MKLTFHGTRGYIEPRSDLHRMHSVCEVAYRGKGVLIDCGEDWLGKLDRLSPRAIVLTHAHPDHAWGLEEGAPCPVYATQQSWEVLHEFPIEERRVLNLRDPTGIRGITFEAFPVAHSTRAPAVGYRITAGVVSIFYVPDVVYIEDRAGALSGVKLYVGDGATIDRSMVRKPDEELIGHTPLRTQLTWCRKLNVPRAIITHCGAAIVDADPGEARTKIDRYARERDVTAEIAHDGMEVVLR